MLVRLYVKNVALITEADIEFDSGLNVLSGETGSGKSVILDSVNFVLGSKADRTMIRYGEKEAFVRAEFSVDGNSKVFEKLQQYDIESDGLIVISRKLGIDGKGSIKINGNSVTVSMLKNVTQHLVDVHGQSEHFFLLNENNQLNVVDGLLGEQAKVIKDELHSLLLQKKDCRAKISALGGDEAERARRIDLLEYQIKEIENADLKVGELTELKANHLKIVNVEKILSSLNSAKNILDSDGGCLDGIISANRELNRISDLDECYNNVCSRLEEVSAELSDISETLSDMADGLSFDEAEAQYIEDRLSLIKSLQKKYGVDEESILSFRDTAQAEYDVILNSAEVIESCRKKIVDCDDKIFQLCLSLTRLRKNAAEDFCLKVENELKTLNIPDAKFRVNFNDYNKDTADLQSDNGSDKISFEFSANKGEPLKPLNKVISGGEMSRFMLSVKTVLKDINGISTYIFDEIDAGISGYTAGTVAGKFKDIAKNTQILAVSHLPQVCAASDAQFLIYKTEENGKTFTQIKKLSKTEKIEELVRLTGSVSSLTAKIHAEELIKQFNN